MEPRKPDQGAWSPLPADLIELTVQSLTDSFDLDGEDRKAVVRGALFPEEVQVSVGIHESDALGQIHFVVSADLTSKQKTLDVIQSALDAAISLLTTHIEKSEDSADNDESGEDLEDDDADLEAPVEQIGFATDYPRVWTPYEWHGSPFFARFDSTNTELEAEANRLLELSEPGLYNELLHPEFDIADTNTEGFPIINH